MSAIREMETFMRSWHEGDYSDDEFKAKIDDLVSRHAAKTEVAKVYGNGLKKYLVKDKNGEVIAEYTGK